jgi:hypothetical protein
MISKPLPGDSGWAVSAATVGDNTSKVKNMNLTYDWNEFMLTSVNPKKELRKSYLSGNKGCLSTVHTIPLVKKTLLSSPAGKSGIPNGYSKFRFPFAVMRGW